MREIRTSGSEGGGAGNLTGPPYPYLATAPLGPAPSHRPLPISPGGTAAYSPGFQPWVGGTPAVPGAKATPVYGLRFR